MTHDPQYQHLVLTVCDLKFKVGKANYGQTGKINIHDFHHWFEKMKIKFSNEWQNEETQNVHVGAQQCKNTVNPLCITLYLENIFVMCLILIQSKISKHQDGKIIERYFLDFAKNILQTALHITNLSFSSL